MNKYLPSLDWIKGYQKGDLSGDLSAGVTVGIMLIPQGMAYAMIAGVPPIYGLYASAIPLLVYAIMGTSRQLSVGPAAMISLLIASGVGQLASFGSEEYIAFTLLLALMVGIFQLLLGAFRLGFLVNFLSHPVVSGFTSGAAIIISLNQVKHIFGVDVDRSNYIHELIPAIVGKLGEIHVVTIIIGLFGILIILVSRKLSRKIPGSLIAVIFGIVFTVVFDLEAKGVRIIGEVPGGLPGFSVPAISWEAIKILTPSTLTIALIGFMESFAVARALQMRHKNYSIDANKELVALGLSNLVGSFFKAFPTTGGFGRSAVNDQAGAKTGLASIVSAVVIIFTLLFFTELFYNLPQAILGAVILVAVISLIDWKEIKFLWNKDKRDLAMLLITLFGTLFFGVEEGILVGVVISLAMVVHRSSYPHTAILGRIPGTKIYRNIKRFPKAELSDDYAIFRFDAQLFFANINHFRAEIFSLLDSKPALKYLVISSEAINYIDSSAIHALHDLIADLKKREIQLVFSAVKGPIRDLMYKNGIMEEVGKEYFFNSTAEAVDHVTNPGEIVDNQHALQTNED